MAFQIKDILRLKRSGGRDTLGLRIVEYNQTFRRKGSVFLLGSFDIVNDAESQPISYASRAAGTLLLRRAQMLQ